MILRRRSGDAEEEHISTLERTQDALAAAEALLRDYDALVDRLEVLATTKRKARS